MKRFEPQASHVVSIELAESLLDVAIARAKTIEDENRRKNRVGSNGNTYAYDESLKKRIMGYAGEAALATHLGRPVPRAGDHFQDRPDVGGYDAMTTDRTDGRLIFSPRHPLWSVKVLVISEWPVFHITGCYLCADARTHNEWWREPRPGGGAWFVPQAELRPVNEGEDVRPLGRDQKQALDRFSHDWREYLTASGVDAPNASPLGKAVVKSVTAKLVMDKAVTDKMAAEDYGSTNAVTYNPGGLVMRSDVPPHLQTYHPREEP